MEDTLKALCQEYVNDALTLRAFKQGLKSLLEQAQDAEMLEFAQTVIAGLADEKGH